MKKLLYILSIIAIQLNAQTITPHVINSAGNSQTVSISGTNYFFESNIGEPIVTTVGNGSNTVTQGFLQPDVASIGGIVFGPLLSHESCFNKNDGFIQLNVTGQPANTFLTIKWKPDTICTFGNCTSLNNLAPGTYTVRISAIANNDSISLKDVIITTFVIKESTEACQITTYNAFSPGNDGLNDTWIIPNITDFPENVVTFYNRWGVELNRIPNYNNKDKVWDGTTKSGNQLTNGTYFYVIELNNGAKPLKGWLELTGSR